MDCKKGSMENKTDFLDSRKDYIRKKVYTGSIDKLNVGDVVNVNGYHGYYIVMEIYEHGSNIVLQLLGLDKNTCFTTTLSDQYNFK